ncbi:DNA cytosine methyltransferase [Mycoplasmopsis columbinasalis]|uniref:Cytosine-specific methyltransferase n=1 Tax=Mycoplasmopsis columbinasalis TaxID=114880 RepID=A0A449BA07_9BACT|nr:DNA cytosine methyltransferase [Mycoplasmopsis columbinasalis]VEU78021.1 Cytosine-specific DNA methyltransferase/Type II site-specific deoxyribonuclease [Mycoplasmopsis columbinasalis]
MNHEKRYKVIELFAGAGGLALGIELAGFETIGLVEMDKWAAQTLRKNRPSWNVIQDDIKNVSKKNLEQLFDLKRGELDLLSGGPPCQSFSYAGKKLGLDDTRGTLFNDFALFLEKLKPKMFLFENVKGLLSHNKGHTFKQIIERLQKTGYAITSESYKVLNAWNYGVPQKRERLILVGIRQDLIHKTSFNFPEPHLYKPTLKDVLPNCPASEGAKYSLEKKKIFELVPPGGYWRDIPEKIARSYMKKTWETGGGKTGILRRLSYSEPALTILTSPSQKQTERCHPAETRPLTIRESARCQTFPDDWQFEGGLSEKYKQIGNAVPVNLAKAIGEKIKESLDKLCEN